LHKNNRHMFYQYSMQNTCVHRKISDRKTHITNDSFSFTDIKQYFTTKIAAYDILTSNNATFGIRKHKMSY